MPKDPAHWKLQLAKLKAALDALEAAAEQESENARIARLRVEIASLEQHLERVGKIKAPSGSKW